MKSRTMSRKSLTISQTWSIKTWLVKQGWSRCLLPATQTTPAGPVSRNGMAWDCL